VELTVYAIFSLETLLAACALDSLRTLRTGDTNASCGSDVSFVTVGCDQPVRTIGSRRALCAGYALWPYRTYDTS